MRGNPLGRGPAFLSFIAVLLLASLAAALPIRLEQPKEGEFVRDLANLIDDADERRIAQVAKDTLERHGVPIIVVTIPSMASVGGEDLRIETFATILFDQWGIGQPTSGLNNGVLLLVSRDDRKARIELGADWRRHHDVQAQRIMDGTILPRFKQGRFSAGIAEGVDALADMARQGFVELPAQPATPATLPGDTAVERDDRPQKQAMPQPSPTHSQPPPYREPEYQPRGTRTSPVGIGGGICGSLACSGIVPIIVIFVIFSIIRSIGRGFGFGGGGYGYTPRYRRGGSDLLTGMMLGGMLGGGGHRRSSGFGGFGSSSRGSSFGGSSFGGSSGGGGSRSFGGGSSGGGGASGSW